MRLCEKTKQKGRRKAAVEAVLYLSRRVIQGSCVDNGSRRGQHGWEGVHQIWWLPVHDRLEQTVLFFGQYLPKGGWEQFQVLQL